MRANGMALRSRMAAYSPAGPPPRHTIRFMAMGPSPSPYRDGRGRVIFGNTSSVNYLTRDPTHEHPIAARCRRRPHPGAAHGRHPQGRHPGRGPDRAARAGDADDPAAAAVPAVEAVLAGGDLALCLARSGLALET